MEQVSAEPRGPDGRGSVSFSFQPGQERQETAPPGDLKLSRDSPRIKKDLKYGLEPSHEEPLKVINKILKSMFKQTGRLKTAVMWSYLFGSG